MGLRLACLPLGVLLAACQSPPLPPTVNWPAGAMQNMKNARGEVLLQALGLIGTPYRNRGNTPEHGFDCSGLIVYVFYQVGISLPRSTANLMAMPVSSIRRDALEVGDLVFFATNDRQKGKVSHAGIYSGGGRFIHAPSTGGTVRMDYLNNRYWQSRYLGAKRVLAY